MMTEKYVESHYDADEYAFGKRLIGRRIVQLTEDRAYLDDGTVLEIYPAGDCCAWFDGVFRAIDLDDNAITRVDAELPTSHDNDELFTINIYTAHKQIAAVDVVGDEGNGYYGSSIELRVYRKENNDSTE